MNRWRWVSVAGALLWSATVPVLAADSFAAGVLSCAAESDRERRLDCYDRAVANYTAGLGNGRRTPAADTGAAPPAPVTRAAPAGAPAAASGTPAASPGGTAASTSTAPRSDTAAAAPAGKPVKHVAAHIVSIDHFPDYVVVHLDNQQTWKQVSDSPGGLALRNGDSVTIDREMGTYWLAGTKGESVQVRLEASSP